MTSSPGSSSDNSLLLQTRLVNVAGNTWVTELLPESHVRLRSLTLSHPSAIVKKNHFLIDCQEIYFPKKIISSNDFFLFSTLEFSSAHEYSS